MPQGQAGPGKGGKKPGPPKPKNMKKTLKTLMSYLGKYKLQLIIVMVLIVVNSIAMVAGSYFLKPLVNNYILPGDFSGLAKMLAVLGTIFGLGALASYGYARLMVHVAQNTISNIRTDLFNKMQELPIKYFDRNTHGDLMSLYTNDIDNIGEALNNSFTNILASGLTFIGTISMMVVLSPVLIIITVTFLALMIFVISKVGAKSKYYFGMQQKNIGALNGYVEEMIEGQKVIKVFCHEEEAIEDFKKHNEELRKASTGAQTFGGYMMPMLGNLSHMNYAVTCCVGGLMTIAGAFDLGSLVSYLQYTKQVSNPIAQVSQQVNMILAALAGAERIFTALDEEVEVDDGEVTLTRVEVKEDGRLVETDKYTGHWAWKVPASVVAKMRNTAEAEDTSMSEMAATTATLNDSKIESQLESATELSDEPILRELTGDVRFKNVVFGYNEEKTVLKDISLFAKPGQKIAFVGSTGAGKTTITNLINRFYEINSGTITYDGIDIKDIKKDDLRRSLGIVLQDTHLFTGTIADNIRYGNLNATDEEVKAAAKLANAHTFIKHLPHGYDTVITGDGEGLSQGQRQLLAIARAAIANPPVLIMDEATSSIDTRTEKLIAEGMDKLMEGRTVFVIAHRLSTIKNSHAIMVLEQGEIIERGNHDSLLEEKGRYYQLYTGKAELDAEEVTA
ncbi:ABC transporter ATP-binding protein [Clostridium saudiense]|uniref:ABC transporter ATP-binding protein n=1 Tax=Clostridium saudiense TaxID=1414720 RepID=A0ABS2FFH8_9CLOT|nr:ABC transporter ATP-binding protein [Clostridium saudiense]MBM6819066.1 ABC transporter ATP-binding protein [Clostridium saudiense]